jgi:hypothetical protein
MCCARGSGSLACPAPTPGRPKPRRPSQFILTFEAVGAQVSLLSGWLALVPTVNTGAHGRAP